MKLKQFIAIAIFLITIAILILYAEPAKTTAIVDVIGEEKFAPVFGCELQPPANPPDPSLPATLTSIPITLDRFRQPLPTAPKKSSSQKSISYIPREIIALAAASNYGSF